MVEDVVVQVDKFYFLVDFIVLDTHFVANPSTQILVILGYPFLATSDAFIHYRNGVMRLAFGNVTCELNIFNVLKQVGDEGEIHEVSCIERLVQDCMQNSFFTNPVESWLVSPTSVEYALTNEIESLYSLLELSEACEVKGWTPKFEELPPSEVNMLPSSVQPHMGVETPPIYPEIHFSW